MVIKPKILIVVLALIIIVGAVVVLQQKEVTPPGEEVKGPIAICKEAGENEEACLKEAAIVENDPVLCDGIKAEERLKFECYVEMAIQLENPELCKKITRKLEYDVGKNVLTISEDECYWWYSLAHATTEVCSSIVNEAMKSNCEQGIEPLGVL